MDDRLKVWTTVGSAGTLNQTDLAKVSLHQSVIQLGVELLPPVSTQAVAAQAAGGAVHPTPVFPTTQAVVRYDVTPVDGLFIAGRFRYREADAGGHRERNGDTAHSVRQQQLPGES
jgi:hypothetical protein